jgi:hypothetical protein
MYSMSCNPNLHVITKGSSPFKGEGRRGMGCVGGFVYPIPTPTLPLKGRELSVLPLEGEGAIAVRNTF